MANTAASEAGRTMIVTDTNLTYVWYRPSWNGERLLVDITGKRWSIAGHDCRTWPEVVNCIKAHGHDIVDSLIVDV